MPDNKIEQNQFDVIILGGGLSGLGLARQLINRNAKLQILVLEKASFPRPKAIAKVGESTVEIGSQYLANELGLSSFLKQEQLKKFGIRIFFDANTQNLDECDELGASQTFGIPTYQIDRGDIENKLHDDLINDGVSIFENAFIEDINIQKFDHGVCVSSKGQKYEYKSRWLLDCAGRASFIKRKKNLAKDNAHKSHAIWFRVDKAIKIDNWSTSEDWRALCKPMDRRWLSTNHLVGPGYWLWIIPLSSGVTSIGIVMDDEVYAETDWQSYEGATAWIAKNQSRLSEELTALEPLDYVALPNYSYDCKQFFSSEGWAVTGEAGAFADPLYSPGSDFIAISNELVCTLVTSETSGKDITFDAAIFEKIYRSIYENTLSLYVGQYGGFGDRQMMGLKLLWDYSYYWGVLSLLYFRKAFTDISVLRKVSAQLTASQKLNAEVQAAFRKRAEKRQVFAREGIFMNQYQIPCLQHFNRILEKPNDTELEEDLKQNVTMLNDIAKSIIDMLSENSTLQISERERALLGDYRSVVLQDTNQNSAQSAKISV